MAEFNFNATARVPTRPLSYENRDLAEPKELLIDYQTYEIYITDASGVIHNITQSVQSIIDEVTRIIKEKPDMIVDAEITLTNGNKVSIENAILQNIKNISTTNTNLNDTNKNLQKTNEFIYSKIIKADGTVVIKVPATNINTDDKHLFVSSTEKSTWNAKSKITNLTTTIQADNGSTWVADAGGAPYYVQTVTLSTIKSTDNPIVDVILSENYNTAKEELENYGKLYRILTYDGYIKVYASEPTKVSLNIALKVDR